MKTVKRTFFNKLFQPRRIGQQRRGKTTSCRELFIKRTQMQITRRAHQGQKNTIIARHAAVKKYLNYPNATKYVSHFVKRATV